MLPCYRWSNYLSRKNRDRFWQRFILCTSRRHWISFHSFEIGTPRFIHPWFCVWLKRMSRSCSFLSFPKAVSSRFPRSERSRQNLQSDIDKHQLPEYCTSSRWQSLTRSLPDEWRCWLEVHLHFEYAPWPTGLSDPRRSISIKKWYCLTTIHSSQCHHDRPRSSRESDASLDIGDVRETSHRRDQRLERNFNRVDRVANLKWSAATKSSLDDRRYDTQYDTEAYPCIRTDASRLNKVCNCILECVHCFGSSWNTIQKSNDEIVEISH